LTVGFEIQAHYRDYDKMVYARSVAVIHNMAHQGRGPMAELAPMEIPSHYENLVRQLPFQEVSDERGSLPT